MKLSSRKTRENLFESAAFCGRVIFLQSEIISGEFSSALIFWYFFIKEKVQDKKIRNPKCFVLIIEKFTHPCSNTAFSLPISRGDFNCCWIAEPPKPPFRKGGSCTYCSESSLSSSNSVWVSSSSGSISEKSKREPFKTYFLPVLSR